MNEDELLAFNYKKPKRLDFIDFIGSQVSFIWGKKARTGTITKVYRDWEDKERIRIDHDDSGKLPVTTEYGKKEFKRAIESGGMKVIWRKA